MQRDDFRLKIRQILLTDWDPVGIRDNPKLSDEYDRYVSVVEEEIIRTDSVELVSELLKEIETNQIGLETTDALRRATAIKLVALRS